MRGKAISVLIVIFIAIGLAGVFFYDRYFTKQTGGSYRNITDMSSSYNADAEIKAALELMKTSREKATIISNTTSIQRKIALTFDGLSDRTIMQKILDLLEKHKVKATFFVDGMQTAEDPQAVVLIKQGGHKVENYSLLGIAAMEKMSPERLVKDFCRSQKIVKVTTDNGPNLLKCNDTKYTEVVLQAAKACGFKSVVKNDVLLNGKNLHTAQAATSFVTKLPPGSIVSVRLKPNTDLIVDEKGKIDLKPAVDKQPGLRVLTEDLDTGEKELISAVEKFLIALNQEKVATVYVDTYPAAQTASGQEIIRFSQAK